MDALAHVSVYILGTSVDVSATHTFVLLLSSRPLLWMLGTHTHTHTHTHTKQGLTSHTYR